MIERDGHRLRISGALTIENAASVCADIGRELGAQPLVIDLAPVTEVDSAALSAIFELQREAKRQRAQVSFSNIPESLHSLATLYGVSDLLNSEDARKDSK